MQTLTHYRWTPDDPSLAFVEHALNRLASFTLPSDEPAEKAMRRCIEGAGDFTSDDIALTCTLLRSRAQRAHNRASDLRSHTRGGTCAEPEGLRLTSDELVSAAENARTAADELTRIFMEARK